jgi:hypothetical protein
MFEQRRCQGRAASEDQVRRVFLPDRLDAAKPLDDFRSQALERVPFQTIGPVGCDVFRGRVQAVRERTARGRGPVARPDIVGAPAVQEIEGLAMRRKDRLSGSGIAI